MKKKERRTVPRSSLREKLSGLMPQEERDPWAVETVNRKKQPLFQRFPFTVLKEMHQNLFQKVMACLTIIVIILLVNIINVPFVNTLGDGLHRLVTWNMDLAALPEGAMEVLNTFRGRSPSDNGGVPPGPEAEGLSMPVHGASILSRYGIREHPVRGSEMHYGIDLVAPAGSPVFAVLGGTVLQAGEDSHYGYSVVLQHQEGVKTFYGYLKDIQVAAGDKVDEGQELALVAERADEEPYLHFEVWVNDRPVDPMSLLARD